MHQHSSWCVPQYYFRGGFEMNRILTLTTAVMVVLAGFSVMSENQAEAGLFNRNKCCKKTRNKCCKPARRARKCCKTACCEPKPCCEAAPAPCGCEATASCGCESNCQKCCSRRQLRKAKRQCCSKCSTCCGAPAAQPCGCSGGAGAAPEAAPAAPEGDATT